MLGKPIYKLRDWIPFDKLLPNRLLCNPDAIFLLDEHWDAVHCRLLWYDVCANEHAMQLVENHWETMQHKMHWHELCSNPDAVHLLVRHWKSDDLLQRQKIKWKSVCANPNPRAIALLEDYWSTWQLSYRFIQQARAPNTKDPNYTFTIQREYKEYKELDWTALCSNPSAPPFLEKLWVSEARQLQPCLKECFNWFQLCKNPEAVAFLERHWEAVLDKIHWVGLCCNPNPNALVLLDQHWETVIQENRMNSSVCVWASLFLNPNAFVLLDEHWEDPVVQEHFTWEAILSNPKVLLPLLKTRWGMRRGKPYSTIWLLSYLADQSGDAISFLELHWDELVQNSRIGWMPKLCRNPDAAAISLLERHWTEIQHMVDWRGLCGNPNAIPLLDRHWYAFHDKFYWEFLCANPNAVSLLEKHWTEIRHKIDWRWLCSNPNAIPLLENHWAEIPFHAQQYKVMGELLNNLSAMPLLEKHWEEICIHIGRVPNPGGYWRILSENPAILELDLAAMRAQARPFAEELAAKVFHPKRMAIWSAWVEEAKEEDEATTLMG